MEAQSPQKNARGAWLAEGRKKARERGVVFGRKVGVKLPATMKREASEKAIKQIIFDKAEKIIRASIIPALGMNFVYRIDEEKDLKGRVISKKHILVESPEEIAQALDEMEAGGDSESGNYYYVTTRAPDYRAGESLLNRAFGKPKETLGVEVEHKFSLRDLGKKADEQEKLIAREAKFTETRSVEPALEVALPAENISSEVPPIE